MKCHKTNKIIKRAFTYDDLLHASYMADMVITAFQEITGMTAEEALAKKWGKKDEQNGDNSDT